MKTATYIGGPLNGQTVTKPGRGRWAAYRDDNGQPIPAHRGDREFCTWAGRHLRRYYQLTPDGDGDTYIHATVVKQREASRDTPDGATT